MAEPEDIWAADDFIFDDIEHVIVSDAQSITDKQQTNKGAITVWQ